MPIAMPIIMAGIRMAVVINIGIAAIATYIGAGGLGRLISRGISQSDSRQLIAGALIVGGLAIVADFGLALVQRRLTPAGLRTARLPLLSARLGGRNRRASASGLERPTIAESR
jgi:osmoprotectant transport system permease protein